MLRQRRSESGGEDHGRLRGPTGRLLDVVADLVFEAGNSPSKPGSGATHSVEECARTFLLSPAMEEYLNAARADRRLAGLALPDGAIEGAFAVVCLLGAGDIRPRESQAVHVAETLHLLRTSVRREAQDLIAQSCSDPETANALAARLRRTIRTYVDASGSWTRNEGDRP